MAEPSQKEAPQADTGQTGGGAGDSFREEPFDGRMTFTEHLGELRTRLIRGGVAIFVGVILCYAFSEYLMDAVTRPLRAVVQVPDNIVVNEQTGEQQPSEEGGNANGGGGAPPDSDSGDGGGTGTQQGAGGDGSTTNTAEGAPAGSEADWNIKWVTLSPLEAILVKLKLAAYGGILLTLPFLIYQGCAFIFPGLTSGERRIVYILMFGCSFFAIAGAAVAYFLVLPLVLPYLAAMTPGYVDTQLQLSTTIGVISKALVGFALAFQFPMVVLVLVYMGLLTPATLRAYRKLVIIGMFVVSAMLTPPEPFSMLIMAIPMILLYELSIIASHFIVRFKHTSESP